MEGQWPRGRGAAIIFSRCNVRAYLPVIKKIIIYFFNMCYGVYYHVVKFQLKTPPMHGEMKKTNYSRG